MFGTLLLLLIVELAAPQANNNALYQCGVRKKVSIPLIAGGIEATDGQWPWHAGVFSNDGSHSRYLCGASLLDQRHVLTVAHCVDRRYMDKKEYFEVHLGQHALGDLSDVQVMTVSVINVHPKYNGTVHLNDMAVLELSSDAVFSDRVVPICLDRRDVSSIAKLTGRSGWVAGWGLTETGHGSNVLLTTQVSVISHIQCVKQDPQGFVHYLDEAMFCAGGSNGSGICQGDSGGGIFFNEGHRWVLKGMISFGGSWTSCPSTGFDGYANVQYHIGWIRELIGTNDATSAVVLQGNDLYQCGVRKRVGVQLIHHGWTAEAGQWPWHAGLYHYSKDGSSKEYQCGGILLDQRHVLTSAHCVVRKNWAPMNPETLAIHLGQLDRLDLSGVLVVNVSEVHVHPEFATNRNDIAVLVLEEEVDYSDYVIPICLDEGSADGDISRYFGHRGTVVGWGRTEGGEVSRLLRMAQMPIVDHVQCVQADPNLFGRFFDRGMFCAGERNGTSVCKGDSGGGLYVNEGDRWVLKGVVSFSGVDASLSCDTMSYAGFANVQHYLGWIRNFTSTKDGNREQDDVYRRSSERACNEYKKLARKRTNGVCWNSRHQHSVGILFKAGEIKCSGVLVSRKYVAAPCHCLWEVTPSSVRISSTDKAVASAVCHPDFKAGSFEHDIALIELASEVELSATLIPACLASNWTENLYDTLLSTGYFSNSESDQLDFLETVDNKWLPDEECRRKTPEAFGRLANGSHLCVISPSREQEGFEGVSGCALQTFNTRNCMHTVMGLLNSVASDEAVSIYGRVSRVLEWVEGVVWGGDRTAAAPPKKIVNSDFVFPDQLK